LNARILTSLLVLASAPLAALAQSPVLPAPSPEGLIHIDVTVTDAQGVPVSNLPRSRFQLLDNGVQQDIVSFRDSRYSNKPNAQLTEVVLVLDQLDLKHVPYDTARSGILQFLRQDAGRLAWPVSLYLLKPDGLYATQSPSIDGNQLAADLERNRLPRAVWANSPADNRNGFDSARLAPEVWREPGLRALYTLAVERLEQPGRKAVLWLGGWPQNAPHVEDRAVSFEALVELATRIREAHLVLCQTPIPLDPTSVAPAPLAAEDHDLDAGVRSVSDLAAHPERVNGYFSLRILSRQSGGLAPDKPTGIVPDIARALQYAATYYTLSFNPPHAAQTDEYHRLSVQIAGPGGPSPALTAQTSAAYYDQPVFYDQPRIPSRQVTASELEQFLASSEKRESGLAERLANLQLTERVSSADLAAWRSQLHSERAQAALTALVDEAAFLPPAPSLLAPDAAPDAAEQHRILALTVDYLNKALPFLPDFYATRKVFQYDQFAPAQNIALSSNTAPFEPHLSIRQATWKTALPDQTLHQAVTGTAILRYRNGHEEQSDGKRHGSDAARGSDLNIVGIFGPILNSILADATRAGNKLEWARWERSAPGSQGQPDKIAVFRYQVTTQSDFYSIGMCCLKNQKNLRLAPPYFGELFIDPATGVILRFTTESRPGWIVEPNLDPVLPMVFTGTMVEYGPVQIGDRTFICPTRGVVITRTRPVRHLTYGDNTFEVYSAYQTLLDDMAYSRYHKFGGNVRILPGFEEVP
jgi:VWFA-related protein